MSELHQYLRATWAVAKVTMREVLRDKILYSSFFVGISLLLAGSLGAQLTYIRPDRIVLNLGLAAISLASLGIAILVASPMLGKEFERRTIFVALSKPITRFQYLFGKYLGLAGVLTLNWILLVAIFIAILLLNDGAKHLHGVTAWALILVLAQSFLGGAIAIMFSSFSTTALSVMSSGGIFLIGASLSHLKTLAAKSDSEFYAAILSAISTIWPNFETFQLGFSVTYELPYSAMQGFLSLGYCAGYMFTFLLIAGFFINRRES